MDIKALQFESRFSLPPNSLGYCGKNTAPEKFKKCIIGGDCDGVEEEVTKFIVLHPYLETLAKITSLPIFSYRLFEGYWLGNEILERAKLSDYDLLLDMFLKQGVPDFFVEELRHRKPEVFIPSHLFQVLHVGVGRASGAVPFNLSSINNCMIRWGKIIELKVKSSKFKVHNSEIKIKLNSLKQNGKKYELCEIDEIVPINIELVKGVRVGDIVAVHWNMVVKKLTKGEVKKLDYWTKKVIQGNF